MAIEWNVPRPATHCGACGREFAIGELHQAVVLLNDEQFERKDLCMECQTPEGATAVGSWRVRRPEPSQKRAAPFDREAMYAFFARLDDDDSRRSQFRFVLGLLLWRKKVLQLIDTVDRDGREVWRFSAGKGKQTHEITRPELDEDEVQRLSDQLETLLAGGAPQDEFIAQAAEGADA